MAEKLYNTTLTVSKQHTDWNTDVTKGQSTGEIVK